MRLFGKSSKDVVNRIGRKSGIPMYNIGSKLDIGNKLSQRMDEYGTKEEQQPKSDLERHRREPFEIRHHHRR